MELHYIGGGGNPRISITAQRRLLRLGPICRARAGMRGITLGPQRTGGTMPGTGYVTPGPRSRYATFQPSPVHSHVHLLLLPDHRRQRNIIPNLPFPLLSILLLLHSPLFPLITFILVGLTA